MEDPGRFGAPLRPLSQSRLAPATLAIFESKDRTLPRLAETLRSFPPISSPGPHHHGPVARISGMALRPELGSWSIRRLLIQRQAGKRGVVFFGTGGPGPRGSAEGFDPSRSGLPKGRNLLS